MKHSNSNEGALLESVIAREIVKEINRYGVSQDQIKQIIKLLALELEDNMLMKNICNFIGENKENSRQDLVT